MKPTKGLILYRRHSAGCDVHSKKLSAAQKRFWPDCSCPVWVFGNMPNGDQVPRQSTGFNDLKQAEAFRASKIAEHTQSLAGDAAHGPTLAECVLKYIASRRDELGEKTTGQYELILKRLQTFCSARGVFYMRELNVDLLETFKVDGLSGLATTSKATAVAKVRCFLRDAFRRGWITDYLVEKVKPQKAVYEQKEPYTDDEVAKILTQAEKLNGGTHAYAKHPKTFRLLLELMLETGMRVGDAIRFNPATLVKGEHLWIYTYLPQKRKKTDAPKAIEAYLTDKLKSAISGAQWLSPALPFMYGSFANDSYLANEVYYRMQTIGERCGVSDCRPHRLRDTFAVRKLLSGFQLEDVSRLLGHSSVKVTETYYAKWVASRKRRLERLLAETLVNS